MIATDSEAVGTDPASSVEAAVLRHGGLDLLVADLDSDAPHGIQESLLAAALPFLKLGADPAIVAIASGPSSEAVHALNRLTYHLQESEGPAIRSCLAHSETGEAMLSASRTSSANTLPRLVRTLATA